MKPITIAGGGLAGLTLGIGLRQRGVPVTVAEAGRYPRHRVCGEFISGRGRATLARLGLRGLVECASAGADTAAFFSANRSTGPRPLPTPAICLSRFTLDNALAGKFRELGGELHEGRRQDNPAGGEGTVRATGRRTQVTGNGARWFGLKVHARHVSLAADVEMHVSPQGYVGLCRLADGAVNVCGLFRRRAGERLEIRRQSDSLAESLLSRPSATLSPVANGGEGRGEEERQLIRRHSNFLSDELLRGPMGSPLRERLAGAEFDASSFCAVAGLALEPHRAASRAECCIGDAITMIPPVTGNGMSMAFESAELAMDPLAGWSRGQITWTEARSQIARRCDAAFARRLAWAKWLQRLLLTPSLQDGLVALVAGSDRFWRLVFAKTR